MQDQFQLRAHSSRAKGLLQLTGIQNSRDCSSDGEKICNYDWYNSKTWHSCYQHMPAAVVIFKTEWEMVWFPPPLVHGITLLNVY